MVGPSGFTANTASTGNITAVGAYNVTVTDANGCTSSCSRTLTVNPLPVCNITGNNTVCSGVSTSFIATGGTSYSWSGPLALLLTLLQQETLLLLGAYNVTVTDANVAPAVVQEHLL
jgi:hypothetical protein